MTYFHITKRDFDLIWRKKSYTLPIILNLSGDNSIFLTIYVIAIGDQSSDYYDFIKILHANRAAKHATIHVTSCNTELVIISEGYYLDDNFSMGLYHAFNCSYFYCYYDYHFIMFCSIFFVIIACVDMIIMLTVRSSKQLSLLPKGALVTIVAI